MKKLDFLWLLKIGDLVKPQVLQFEGKFGYCYSLRQFSSKLYIASNDWYIWFALKDQISHIQNVSMVGESEWLRIILLKPLRQYFGSPDLGA